MRETIAPPGLKRSRPRTGLDLIFLQRFAHAIFEIDPLLLDNKRSILHKGIEGADVFSNDAHEEHLD